MATTINTHYSLTPTSDSEKKILLYNDKYVLTRERNWANIQEGGGDYTNIDNLLFFKDFQIYDNVIIFKTENSTIQSPKYQAIILNDSNLKIVWSQESEHIHYAHEDSVIYDNQGRLGLLGPNNEHLKNQYIAITERINGMAIDISGYGGFNCDEYLLFEIFDFVKSEHHQLCHIYIGSMDLYFDNHDYTSIDALISDGYWGLVKLYDSNIHIEPVCDYIAKPTDTSKVRLASITFGATHPTLSERFENDYDEKPITEDVLALIGTIPPIIQKHYGRYIQGRLITLKNIETQIASEYDFDEEHSDCKDYYDAYEDEPSASWR